MNAQNQASYYDAQKAAAYAEKMAARRAELRASRSAEQNAAWDAYWANKAQQWHPAAKELS